MDINLEKIELVKDRTGSTYAEAKEALEKAEGSVVDAIIDIEEKMNKNYDAVDGGSLKDSPVFAKVKEIVDKGNVTRIIIRKGDKVIVNFPLTAGVIGAVLVPWGAIFGIVAALGAQCDIEFVDDKAEVIAGVDLDKFDKFGDKIEDFAYKTSDKIQEFGDKGSAKVEEAFDKFEENGTVDDIREAFINGTARLMTLWDKVEKSGKLNDVKDAIEKVAVKATDAAKEIAKEAADRAESVEEEFKADADAAAEEEFRDEEI